MLLVTSALLVLAVAGTGAAAPADVPGVALPDVSVPEVPAVPAPPVPLPAPAVPIPPAPALPAVELPAPSPPSVQVPAAPSLSATMGSSTTRQAIDAGTAVATVAQGESPQLFGGTPTASREKRGARSRRTLFGTRYRRPRWLVRGLRGCLDEIPARSSRLLIMRYGVGRFKPMPAATVARRLKLSEPQYDRARRRALRRLVVKARHGGCEGEPLTIAEFAPATTSAGTVWSPPAVTLAAATTGAAPTARDDSEGGVLGRSQEGGKGERPPSAPAAIGPLDLASPASDLPFVLALLALASLCAFLVYRRTRRSKAALEDPVEVARMRR